MSAPSFNYLSYLILFVLVIYVLILAVFLVIRRYEVKNRLRDRPLNLHHHGYDDSSFSFEWTTKLEDVADSMLGKNFRYPLAILRICSSLLFFIYGITILGSSSAETFNFFDGWNVIFLFLYFLAAGVTSVLFLRYSMIPRSLEDDDSQVFESPQWSLAPRFIAVAARLMFEVSGTNTLLLLFGQAISISSTDALQTLNIVAIVLLTVELLLNRMRVRFDQYPASAAWLMCYLLILWPSVFSGSMTSWPYSFLDTADSACLGRYLLLFIADFVSHLVWYLLSSAKDFSLRYLLYDKRHREENGPMIELSEMNSSIFNPRPSQTDREAEEDDQRSFSVVDSFYSIEDRLSARDRIGDDQGSERSNSEGDGAYQRRGPASRH